MTLWEAIVTTDRQNYRWYVLTRSALAADAQAAVERTLPWVTSGVNSYRVRPLYSGHALEGDLVLRISNGTRLEPVNQAGPTAATTGEGETP